MKVLNKVLSVILIVLLSGIFSLGITAEENADTNSEINTESYEYELELIKSLGLIEENASVGSSVRRRDFAKVLYEILTYKTEKPVVKVIEEEETGLKEVYIDTSGFTDEFFFRDEIIEDIDFSADETQVETEDDRENVVPLFSDVSESDDAFEAIMLVHNSGLMTGAGDGKFEPSRNLTVQEISKILVTMLGYRSEANYGGGYPTGYYNAAYKIKLFKGILLPPEAEITIDQATKMIYNAFSVKLLKNDNYISRTDGTYAEIYQVEDGENFLDHTLGLKEIKGQISANEVTTMSGRSDLLKGEIILGNVAYKVSDRIKNQQNYFARNVKAYVTNRGNGMEEIRYMECEDEVTLIEASDIGKFYGNVLTYYQANGREKSVTIDGSIPVIYNGLAVKTPTVDMYDIGAGRIELIEKDNVLVAVKIWKFKSFYVYGIDKIKEEFFNETRTHYVNASDKNDNIAYLLDEDGNVVDFSYVKKDMVASYAQNDNVVTVYLTKKFLSDTIDKISTKDGKTNVTIKTDTYEVAEEYFEVADALSLKVGEMYKFHMDYFGRIAWIGDEDDEAVFSGIVIGVGTKGLGGGSIKFVGLDESEPSEKTYELADAVIIDGSDGRKKKYTVGNEIAEVLADAKYVKYTTNDEEKVNYIRVPLKNKGENGDLYTLVEKRTYNYDWTVFFGGKVPIGEKTKIVVEPADTQNGDAYGIWVNAVNIPSIAYTISAWQVEGEEAPECILMHHNFGGVSSGNLWSLDRYGANEISTAYDPETGEIYKEVEIIDYTIGKRTLRADFEHTDAAGNSCTALDIASGCVGDDVYSIEKGDIFACSFYDSEKTKIKQVILLYRPTMKSPSGGDGYMAVGDENMSTDMFFIQNKFIDELEGEPDFASRTFGTGTYLDGGNPIKISDEITSMRLDSGGSEDMIIHGFLYSMDREEYDSDNYLQRFRQIMRFTSQDLSVSDKYYENGMPDERVYDSTGEYTGIYINRVMNAYNIEAYTFEYTGGRDNYTVQRIATGYYNFRPYKRYGKTCTKVIFTPKKDLFINDNRTK